MKESSKKVAHSLSTSTTHKTHTRSTSSGLQRSDRAPLSVNLSVVHRSVFSSEILTHIIFWHFLVNVVVPLIAGELKRVSKPGMCVNGSVEWEYKPRQEDFGVLLSL